MSRILAIDPGLAEAGVVMFVDGRIVDARTIKTVGNADTDVFAKTVARIEAARAQLADIVRVFDPDVVAIEAYEDFGGGHLRDARRRWTTPMQMGAFSTVLAPRHTRWQRASVVMRQYAEVVAKWKAGVAVFPGDDLLTNDHLRSAAAHGMYALAHERRKARPA